MSGRIEALERLAKLRADGLLTEDEFAAEKRRILAADDADETPTIHDGDTRAGLANEPSHAPPSDAPVGSLNTQALENDPRLRLGPIRSAKEAFTLIHGVWAGVVSLWTSDLLEAIVNVRDLLRGEEVIAGFDRPATFALQAGTLALTAIILGALAHWTVRRRSFIASGFIFFMGLGALAMIASERLSEGGWSLLAQGVMIVLGLWFVFQTIRGIAASRRYDAATITAAETMVRREIRASRPKTAGAALAHGWSVTRLLRRVLFTVAALVLVVGVVVIGVLIWRWSAEDNSIGARAERLNQMQGEASNPTDLQGDATQPPTETQPSIVPTDAYFVGWWVEQGDQCAGSMAFELTSDHRYLNLQAEGSWALLGTTLRFDTVAIDTETERPITARRIDEGQVWIVDQNEFSGRLNGEIRRFRRCQDGTEYEPWGPF